MTISALGEGAVAAQSALSDAMQSSALGKEDFLRLLVTQLQNQDPLQPMENTEFVAQLAQFSSLEQLSNINDQLIGVQIGQMSVSNLEAASLVGREITANGDEFTYDGVGGTDLEFELSGDAERCEVSIYDENGGLVQSLDVGPTSAGEHTVPWDGLTESGTSAGAGRYRIEVQAYDADDEPVEASTRVTGVVTGIFFDRGTTELEVDGNRVRLGEVVNISQPPTDEGDDSDG